MSASRPLLRTTLITVGAVVVLGLLAIGLGSYALVLATRILIFAIFAMSLDLLVGYVGLSSLGHATFFGVAGYAVGLVSLNVVNNLLLGMLAAGVASLGVGLIFAAIALRARLIYFMMLTLALAQVVWGIAIQWRTVTRGDDGFSGIPRPYVGSLQLADNQSFFVLSGVVFLISAAILLRVAHSPFGLTLQGIRESAPRMSALGYNVWLHQYLAFQIAAVFSGVAGALLAYQNGIVTPSQISLVTSAEALLMVILGGAGTMVGPALGAVVIVLLEYVVSQYTGRWISVLGVIYIVVVLRAPSGVYPPLRDLASRLTGRRGGQDLARDRPLEPLTGITAHVDTDA
ncbi:MAG: branched-chain amino acid ABC transporter permease [Chloroflexota bacterium]